MIKEDYVSFEVAKLLKEKGFDAKCDSCYVYFADDDIRTLNLTHPKSAQLLIKDRYPYVTLQMAMKWLREKGIIITITYTMYSLQIDFKMMFGFKIQNVQGKLLAENTEVSYNSYEQAEMDAIKYSLENLI